MIARRAFAVLMIVVAAVVLAAPLFRAPDRPGHATHAAAPADSGAQGHQHGAPDPVTLVVLGANVVVLAGIAVRETRMRHRRRSARRSSVRVKV
ncbi:hypothetical protein [Symbioplanes lichenis]|uniref:hypothetical protein n=1 Tax=Symbioplanes lichenis TaxID=1629072 RepID=UPI002739CE5A|nr:hypothetical protein [Actinoplanes lichenis]